MLTSREYIKALLLDLAWFEAATFGGVKPMQMVAQCVGNRVRLGWGTWSQVLSTIRDERTHPIANRLMADMLLARAVPNVADPRFQRLLPSIDAIYDNSFEDLVDGGVYWGDLEWNNYPAGQSRVFWTTIVGSPADHPRTAQCGTFCTWK